MSIQIRVNRDLRRGRWCLHSLTHKTRLGSATGLLMRSVSFLREERSGWADGELWSWSEIQVDPQFGERLEQRICDNLGVVWLPLRFHEGEFFVVGDDRPLAAAGWMRIVDREAWVALPVTAG